MNNPKLIRNSIIGFLMMIPLVLAIIYPHGPFPTIVCLLSFVFLFIPWSKLK